MGRLAFQTKITKGIWHGTVHFSSWETLSIIIQEKSINTGEALVFQVVFVLAEEKTGLDTDKGYRVKIESKLTSETLILDSTESSAILGSVRFALSVF